jgi:hypothetical protein
VDLCEVTGLGPDGKKVVSGQWLACRDIGTADAFDGSVRFQVEGAAAVLSHP